MEKVDRALYGVEDNAEAIRALKGRMDNAESALVTLKTEYQVGQYKVISSKANSSFGNYRINGPTVFIVTTGDNATHQLYFADKLVLSGVGTLIYKSDGGEGELRIYPNAALPHALVIGDAKKIE